jgi:CTP-dependent riboflavin kinase
MIESGARSIAMIVLKGNVEQGCKHFQRRITDYPSAFRKVTGQTIVLGTLNVKVDRPIPIKEHFRLKGVEIGEPEDFLFEVCRINGIWAYRIRPYDHMTGGGGHGNSTLEIVCSERIPNVHTGASVEIELLRDDLTE